MAADYKHRAAGSRKPQQKSSCWTWLLVGFVLGGFSVGLAWLKLGGGLDGGSGWIGAKPDKEPASASVVASSQEAESEPTFRFDFYDRLSKIEVVVPDDELVAEEPPAGSPVQAEGPPAQYLLQVGSFRKPADADRLKAQLTLLGFEAGIARAGSQDRVEFYRVRVGPYGGLKAMETARKRLAENGFKKTLVVRVKEG